MNSSYRAYPPTLGNISVPIADRESAHAGMSLYAPCRRLATYGHAFLWAMVELNPRFLLVRTSHQGLIQGIPQDLTKILTEEIGVFDNFAAYRPRQPDRSGAAFLLLRGGSPISFVKIRAGSAEALERERLAIGLVASHSPHTFRTPRPLSWGLVENWSYVAYEAIPTGRHRLPPHPHLTSIAQEVGTALGQLPRPLDAPSHWAPMHGDFTPWNLRLHPFWGLVLIDWEDVGWGPPGADETLYVASMRALGRAAQYPPHQSEAREFWIRRVADRPVTNDSALNLALLRTLARK